MLSRFLRYSFWGPFPPCSLSNELGPRYRRSKRPNVTHPAGETSPQNLSGMPSSLRGLQLRQRRAPSSILEAPGALPQKAEISKGYLAATQSHCPNRLHPPIPATPLLINDPQVLANQATFGKIFRHNFRSTFHKDFSDPNSIKPSKYRVVRASRRRIEVFYT